MPTRATAMKPGTKPKKAKPTELRAALDKLIKSIAPRSERLNLGRATTYYTIKGGSRTVCGIKSKAGDVGLHLISIGRTYKDPAKRLVGKGPAGHMLWLRGIEDVESARPFIEQALDQAKRE